MDMNSIRFMKKFIDLLRYDKLYNSSPFILIVVMNLLSIINSSMVVLTERENVEKCLLAIKDIVLMTLMFLCLIDRSLNPHKGVKLLNLIESEFLVNRHEIAGRKGKWETLEKHYNTKSREMKMMSQKMTIIVIAMYFGGANRHIINELLVGTTRFGNESKDWPTFFVYWCPPELDSFVFFIYMQMFQSLLIFFYTAEIFCMHISLCLAAERVLVDYDTVQFLLNEIKNFSIEETLHNLHLDVAHSDQITYEKNSESLRKIMAFIVECHQKLNRNFKSCAANAAFPIFMTSCGMCIDTCMNIYIILKADDLETIISYAAICFSTNLVIFFSYYTGQRIVNQNDIFRRCLADVPWINKPKWFRQSLIIMMSRANVQTEIKPFGIYVLSYLSFKDIMKAALSFGHFLYTTKLKRQAIII